MQNAFVLVHHIGRDGERREGSIVTLSNDLFNELKSNGLVREATREEIEAGDQHGFQSEEDQAAALESQDDWTDLDDVRALLEGAKSSLEAVTAERDGLRAELVSATERLNVAEADLATSREQHDLLSAQSQQQENDLAELKQSLASETKRADNAQAASKSAEEALNKMKTPPANKAGKSAGEDA